MPRLSIPKIIRKRTDGKENVRLQVKTDYWVSQEKKYCEFCKCYISANRASVEFHEGGKNHRDNVAKRLTAMQKKAKKEAMEAEQYENEMKKIEAAALRAYVKDMEHNPDFSSQTMGEIIIPDVPLPMKKPHPAKHKANKYIQEQPAKKWMEALAEDGKKYYWNVETRESVWEAPEDGFLSLEEQQSQKVPKPKVTNSPFKFKKKFGKKGKPNLYKDRANPVKPTEEETPVVFPVYEGHPYGEWEAVPPKSDEPVDLQLPQQETVKIVVPDIKEESDRKFEEKKIPIPGSIVSTSGEIGFKKRKFSSDPKRNMRQRLDND